jgi:hypothetical protein
MLWLLSHLDLPGGESGVEEASTLRFALPK